MSNSSISKNNDAIKYIGEAIEKYKKAMELIELDNYNTLSEEILSDITKTTELLNGLIGNLNSLNDSIAKKIVEKEKMKEARNRNRNNRSVNTVS